MSSARLKVRMQKESKFKMSQLSTNEIMAGIEVGSEDIVRLKVTVRTGARIESVPLKKLEKLAGKKRHVIGSLRMDGLH